MVGELGSRQVCLGTLFALGCWKIGFWLIVLTCFGVIAHPWSILGLAVITVGHMTVLCAQHRERESRERMVFEMGRQAAWLVPESS